MKRQRTRSNLKPKGDDEDDADAVWLRLNVKFEDFLIKSESLKDFTDIREVEVEVQMMVKLAYVQFSYIQYLCHLTIKMKKKSEESDQTNQSWPTHTHTNILSSIQKYPTNLSLKQTPSLNNT
ncbi:hypothetical protein QVD17_35142 [Tagetes erecta]|uniref:Uncharacterized protein n=1 Tax=Tagetes erecta TaxID=13708 RepID=A0AAD8NEX4_TARER|nr:hypothetical protein QVD17_35142 [Tagetes erecta]